MRGQNNYFGGTTNDLEFEGTKQLFAGDCKRDLRDRTMILGGPKATIIPLVPPNSFGPPTMVAMVVDFKDRGCEVVRHPSIAL